MTAATPRPTIDLPPSSDASTTDPVFDLGDGSGYDCDLALESPCDPFVPDSCESGWKCTPLPNLANGTLGGTCAPINPGDGMGCTVGCGGVQDDCPLGSFCVERNDTDTVCIRQCVEPQVCGAGLVCITPDPTEAYGFCLFECLPGTDACPTEALCIGFPYDGFACVDNSHADGGTGEPCTDNAECLGGACVQFPGCTGPVGCCTDYCELATSKCPNGVCVTDSRYSDFGYGVCVPG